MSNLENLRKVYSSKRYVTIHSVELPSIDGARKPKRVYILIGDKEVKAKRDDRDKHVWILPERTIAFDDEKLRIQIRSKSSSRSQREPLTWEPEQAEELAVTDIVSFLGSKDPTESHKYPKRCNYGSVSFQISLQSLFEDMGDCADAALKLVNDNDNELSRLDVKMMKSVLSCLSDNVDAFNTVTNSLKGISKIHPIAQAVTSVVLLPLQLMKNEHIFTGRVKSLVENMKETLERLNMMQNIEGFQYAKDILKSMMKDYLRFQIYVCKLKKMNGAVRMLKAHSDTKELGDFEQRFKENGEKLRDMIMMESAADTKQVLSTQEKDELRRLLDPVVTSRPRECHDGTREGVLQRIEDWIDNSNEKNTLWISGAPGVGKSALSSSTVKLLETRWRNNRTNPFAVFFINRQTSRDPRPIWRTVAHRLALSFPDYRMQLLDILREDTRSDGVKKQFRDLISAPYDKIYGSRHVPKTVPVIVIDALDECLSEADDESVELLETITDWKYLPRPCKLIVFSRRESIIVRRLEADGVSDQIVLPSGQGVADDSEASLDIRKFLKAGFNKISRDHGIEWGIWPEAAEIDQLVGYASGLFIVPTTVIKYVGGLKGDPVGRWHDVLDYMQHWENSSRVFDPIKALYAQILINTYGSLETDDERESMRLVLAFLVFQRDFLRRNDLIQLLSPLTTITSVSSAIDNLMPVIAEGNLICCSHKSFSDVLEKPEALEISFHYDADEAWCGKERKKKIETFCNELLPELTQSAQCLRLAQACLLALNAELSFEFPSPYKETQTVIRGMDNIPPFLCHASRSWQKYCELAEKVSNDLPLNPYKQALDWMESFNLIAKENNSGETTWPLLVERIRVLTSRYPYLVESGLQKDFQPRFGTCRSGLVKEYESVRGRDNDGSQSARHLAESDHEVLVYPKILLRDDAPRHKSLDILAPSFQSLPRGCYEGTRLSILSRIKKWLKDLVPASANDEVALSPLPVSPTPIEEDADAPPRDPPESPTSNNNILRISGKPLSGKTAIASSIVALLNSTEFGDGMPNAHFFLSENLDNDPRLVWRTIAYQLALSSPAYGDFLLEQGVLTMDTKDHNARELFEALIKNPLSRLNISVVVVIDALDECDYGAKEDLFKTVGDWKSMPSTCRLIVTSCDIPTRLDGISHIDQWSTSGSSAESKETMDDIRLLFVNAFKKIKQKGWPEDGVIDELVEYADGSILWATTVIAFVFDGRGGDPRSRLNDVLRTFRCNSGDPDVLLFAHVLMYAHSLLEANDEREIMFLVLAILTVQKAPLSCRELGKLLTCDISVILVILDKLSPILSSGAPDEVVEFTHSYFKNTIQHLRDGLSLPSYIKSFAQHLTALKQNLCVADACLRFMKKSREARAYEHSNSAPQDHGDNTPCVEDEDPASVSNALKYACSFWVDHMNDMG